MNKWLLLGAAIIAEVVGTLSLRASAGFTKLGPSLLVAAGYAAAFYLLSLTLDTIPIGIAYAVWASLGVALVAIASWILFGQKLDPAGILGIALIVAGVIVLNVFSQAGS